MPRQRQERVRAPPGLLTTQMVDFTYNKSSLMHSQAKQDPRAQAQTARDDAHLGHAEAAAAVLNAPASVAEVTLLHSCTPCCTIYPFDSSV